MSTRQPHMLRPTVGNERPGNIVWFDTETDQTVLANGDTRHTLRLGVAIHYRRFKHRGYVEQSRLVFKSLPQFWTWLDKAARNKSTTHLVAHNIVFDLSIVHAYETLASMGWELQSLYSKATTSIFRWKQGERRMLAMDNMNLFQGKLARWGKIFNMEKGHVEFDNVSDQELITYCIRDVEIMVHSWLAWMTFLDEHDLGNFKITTASTAFSAWRHRFMDGKVHIHTNPDALQLERESYHGGRTECFWSGTRTDGPFYYVDVNNMYGYILSRFEFPAGLWNVDTQPTLSRLLRKLEHQSVIARVLIDTDQPVFPISHNNYTLYPVGQLIITLTTPELILCFEQGWIRDVYSMAWYRSAPLFAKYIETFHGLRMKYRHEGNDGYQQIAKMMMNALYGKFGQSGFDQKRIGNSAPSETWSNLVINGTSGEVYRMFALGGGVYEEHKSGESANSFPGIAAHVTAYARLYLWQLINLAGRDHVYYCDTDSMIVDQTGLDRVAHYLDNDKLGYLKIEHTSQSLTINAPKDYSMDERVKVKGVKDASMIMPDQSVNQDQWQRLQGQIKAGNTNDFIVHRVIKNLARQIRSGTVSASGWVQPFALQVDPALLTSARLKYLSEQLQVS